VALRSRPAGEGFKPPHAASAEDRRGEQERPGNEFGDLEQSQLVEQVVDHRDHGADRRGLRQQGHDGQQHGTGLLGGRQPPGGEEDVGQDRIQPGSYTR